MSAASGAAASSTCSCNSWVSTSVASSASATSPASQSGTASGSNPRRNASPSTTATTATANVATLNGARRVAPQLANSASNPAATRASRSRAPRRRSVTARLPPDVPSTAPSSRRVSACSSASRANSRPIASRSTGRVALVRGQRTAEVGRVQSGRAGQSGDDRIEERALVELAIERRLRDPRCSGGVRCAQTAVEQHGRIRDQQVHGGLHETFAKFGLGHSCPLRACLPAK